MNDGYGDEWINKMCYIHTMAYLAIKRNEVLIKAATWTNPAHTMLSKRSQSHIV